MGKNYIRQGIKDILLVIAIVIGMYLLFAYKFEGNIRDIALDTMSFYWVLGVVIYASVLIMIYSYNKQYPNTKNGFLRYFKKFEKKDYWVMFSTIFSLHFLISLFVAFYSVMKIGSVYAMFTFIYLTAAIFGIMGTLFLSGKLIYRFSKKIKQPRIKLNKDRKNILSFWKFIYIDGSYISWNLKSKAPVLIKIFNVLMYSIFLILFLSIIFTINKPKEISGQVVTLGELEETLCRGRGGCMSFHNYLIGIEQGEKIQTFVLIEKEFEKCGWNSTTYVTIETNPITHISPVLNKIKKCQ